MTLKRVGVALFPSVLLLVVIACVPVPLPEPTTQEIMAAFPSCAELGDEFVEWIGSDEYDAEIDGTPPAHWTEENPPTLREYMEWVEAQVLDTETVLVRRAGRRNLLLAYQCVIRITYARIGNTNFGFGE